MLSELSAKPTSDVELPTREAIERQKREQDRQVIALRRLLAAAPRNEGTIHIHAA